MRIPKGYHPFKLISPVQQQPEMAEMLVKRRGMGKPTQKKKKRNVKTDRKKERYKKTDAEKEDR